MRYCLPVQVGRKEMVIRGCLTDRVKSSGTLPKRASICRSTASSFDEAATIFNDPLYADAPDPEHSFDETRYLGIGLSIKGNLLMVAFTLRDTAIRLISARKATRDERWSYEDAEEL